MERKLCGAKEWGGKINFLGDSSGSRVFLPTDSLLTMTAIIFSAEFKKAIAEAFLEMNQTEKWKQKLEEFHVWGFKRVDSSLLDMDQHILNVVKKLTLRPTYY